MKYNFTKRALIALLLLLFFGSAYSQEEDLSLEEVMNRNLVDMSIEDWVGQDDNDRLSFYGFFNVNAEKVYDEPSRDGSGNTIYESGAFEMSTPLFRLYAATKVSEELTVFINLGNSGDEIEIVNAWGNYKVKDMLQFRIGKQYRRFGLFNERLDQVPTYTGIEPPELFDNDHLMLPRFSLISVHGEKELADRASFKYFLTTSSGESGAEADVIPLGWDMRYKKRNLLVGLSGYFSNIGSTKSQSTVVLGEGSPRGGILPWMSGDKYSVFGAFAETRSGNLSIKAAYYIASHDADRDPGSVLLLEQQGLLNSRQRSNMFGSNANNATLTEADVDTNGDFDASTWYIRVGYDINTTIGKFIPYVFMDYYKNTETIASKSWGGDNEAGVSDDGQFTKPSIGVVYKPIDNVAFKVDGSSHSFDFNGKKESYPEIRFDISYMFK